MNGRLSLLSAAVLMALAASGTDSKDANASSVNSLRNSGSGSTGASNSKVLQIHNKPRGTLGNSRMNSALRKGALLSHVQSHRKGAATGPRGSNVLYDQTAGFAGDGINVLQFSSSSIYSSMVSYNSQGADDFVVGGDGWSVTGFNFITWNWYGGDPADNNEAVDVYVYPDNGGLPGASPVCTSVGSTNNPSVYDVYTSLANVTLNTPCDLAPGTYWVAASFENATNPFNWPYAWGLTPSTDGAPGVWRNPGDGFGSGCTEWSTLADCGITGDYGYAFQVVGTAGGTPPGNGLELTLTLALDNGNPDQCGTATSLSVDVGDQVNFCYKVTNHTGVTLDYQTLSDTLGGTLFALDNEPLPDGGSIQYNRIVTAGTSTEGTITATWSSQNGLPTYVSDNTGASNFVDISATGTSLDLSDDGTVGVSLPFSFSFYGRPTNQICVGNNGGLIAGVSSCSLTYTNTALPTAGLGAAILPLWDDFDTESGGVYTETLGTAPNRQFVVEWYQRPHYDGATNTDTATFEVIIDEATGSFSFEYNDVEYTANGSAGGSDSAVCDGGVCATIGLQQDDTTANQYSFNTASVSDGMSIAWTPAGVTDQYSATASATLDVGAPAIAVDPESLSASLDPGATTTSTLTINNTGDRDLTWTIDESPATSNARSHFPAMPYHAPALTDEQRSQLSAKRAPVLTGKDGKPLFASFTGHPAGGFQVPAYGGSNDGTYNTFDAASPSPFTPIALFPGCPTACADYIGGSFANNDFSKEYLLGYSTGGFASIDTTTGAVTVINPDPGTGFGCGALRWDATTSTMFALCADGTVPTTYLYKVDLTTGTFTQVGESDGVFLVSAAFDASGAMYGLDIAGDQLIAMDKTTGAWQAIGPIGFNANYAQDIDFDPSTGVLWYAGYNYDTSSKYGFGAMYTLDTSTGAATEIGEFDNAAEISAFSIAVPSGGCATPDDVPWLSVSPASGTTAPGGSTATTVTFDATGLSPGTYDANLCVTSNDPSHHVVAVPVELTVTGDDEIFADGFDGN